MRKYKFSYDYVWHTDVCSERKGEVTHIEYDGGKFESEQDAMKRLREEINLDITLAMVDSSIDHIHNGIVIIGMDKNNNEVVTVKQIRVEALPTTHYTIIWDDENCCDRDGEFETLEEAKHSLENTIVDDEFNAACVECRNIEIEWDSDGLGFLSVSWDYGAEKDDDDNGYFERTYRIHEINEDGEVIDE